MCLGVRVPYGALARTRPVDGSPLADEALVHTRHLRLPGDGPKRGDAARQFNERGDVLDPDESRREGVRERAAVVVERAGRRAAEAERSVGTVVETGDPAETILAYVDAHDIDHAVMGGHGGERADLARRLLGTVATTVVGEAPVTVTVVR